MAVAKRNPGAWTPLLVAAGLSQEEVLRRTKLRRVRLYMTNHCRKRVGMQLLLQLAGVLGVSPGELLDVWIAHWGVRKKAGLAVCGWDQLERRSKKGII